MQVPVAHEIRTATAAAAFKFNIVSVAGTGVGQFPTVTFSATDPTNGDAPYNIQTDAPFTSCVGGASHMSVNVAWSTVDYTQPRQRTDACAPDPDESTDSLRRHIDG